MILNPFFDTDGNPSPALLEVLTVYGLAHDGGLESIFHVTQRELLQKGAAYRMDIVNRHGRPQDALPLFERLQMLNPLSTAVPADYALILGATAVAVRKRRDYYADVLWAAGGTARQIAYTAGSRTKLSDAEKADATLAGLTTEAQIVQYILGERLVGPWPEGVVWGEVFAHPSATASTFDAVGVWRDTRKPRPGRVIAVSSQPFCWDQALAVEEALGDGFTVIPAGYGALATYGPAMYLDALAKAVDVIARGKGFSRPAA